MSQRNVWRRPRLVGVALLAAAAIYALVGAGVAAAAPPINVSTAAQLNNTFAGATCNPAVSGCAVDGATVVLAPGTYAITSPVTISQAGVTLQGPTSGSAPATISGTNDTSLSTTQDLVDVVGLNA